VPQFSKRRNLYVKQEKKLTSASRSLYTLAVIVIKHYSKFPKVHNMIFPIVLGNMSKNAEAIICFMLFLRLNGFFFPSRSSVKLKHQIEFDPLF